MYPIMKPYNYFISLFIISGIYTGSVYRDAALTPVFPGNNIKNLRQLIVFQTHDRVGAVRENERIIVIVRNPLDTYKADFNRKKTHNNHTKMVESLNATGRL